MNMKAWRLDRLGGALRFVTVPIPEVRPGSLLVRVEASTLMSYMKPYVEGRLPAYHAPVGAFTPGGNCVGVIEAVGKDVWGLAAGRRVLLSSLLRSSENVADAAQLLIGVTSFGPDSEKMQADWPDGSLAEYILLPASSVVPADGFEDMAASRLAVVSRFVVPYGGLVRGRLAAGETWSSTAPPAPMAAPPSCWPWPWAPVGWSPPGATPASWRPSPASAAQPSRR
jgi:alcohol dehydrogenase